MSISLSIVIPIHNEEPAILPLYDRLTTVMERLRRSYEIIFVDDASTDRSFDLLANLVETDSHLESTAAEAEFRPDSGAGSRDSTRRRASVVISLDGDLQHDPEDIRCCLKRSKKATISRAAGAKERVDNAITRKIPSRIANWMMKKASGVELHDFGTTLRRIAARF